MQAAGRAHTQIIHNGLHNRDFYSLANAGEENACISVYTVACNDRKSLLASQLTM